MWQIFIGGLFLSVLHSLIPNHWAPLITLSKTERWTRNEVILGTLLAVFSHTLSTILIGIFVGVVGLKLSENYHMIFRILAPVLLGIIGLIDVLRYMNSVGHSHKHEHFDHRAHNKLKWGMLITLCLAMFLTPCFEIEAYYFQAASLGWAGIVMVSLVYFCTTLFITFLLVFIGLKGVKKVNLHFLDHNEKLITGIILIGLAFIAYYF